MLNRLFSLLCIRDDFATTLQKLAARVKEGFGQTEIAEVLAVAEEMEVEKTKTFRFPIKTGGGKSEFWISIYMDDINSPDLYIFEDPKLLQKFDPLPAK